MMYTRMSTEAIAVTTPTQRLTSTTPSPRVLSVDVLRGLTIALMILVNDPGDWSHTYTQLDHAPWNGFTLTDFVFPNFLFLVGASIIFSLQPASPEVPSGVLDSATKKTLALHILRRALLIFAIKMFLTAFPHFRYTHFRLYGVLTRIALCYLVAGLICLITLSAGGIRRQARTLLIITASLLIGYWILMRFVPVPGLGVPTHDFPILDPNNNLAAWLDPRRQRLHPALAAHRSPLRAHPRPRGPPQHPPRHRHHPHRLHHSPIPPTRDLNVRHSERSEEPPHFAGAPLNPPTAQYRWLSQASSASPQASSGTHGSPSTKISGPAPTSSTPPDGPSSPSPSATGSSTSSSSTRPVQASAHLPLLVFGSNAITAFVLSNFLVELLIWIKVPDSLATPIPGAQPKPVTVWFWLYHHLFARHSSTYVTSLAFAITFVALCFIPNYLLWRKKIFLKV